MKIDIYGELELTLTDILRLKKDENTLVGI